jgi:hypothetical protein
VGFFAVRKNFMTDWAYTPEQKERWDKTLNGPGYYEVTGEQAYTYLTHHISSTVGNVDDPKTVLLIGTEKDKFAWLEKMTECEVIDAPVCCEPRFFFFNDRYEESERVSKTLLSEMDAEQFRNFIATSVEKTYYPIAAVVVFDEFGLPYPYLEKILEVPVWKNGRLEKTIRPQVFNVCEGDTGDDALNFKKAGATVEAIDWRKGFKSFGQLSKELPKFLVDGLMGQGNLTAITGHSFNSKSWFAMQMAWALATGEPAFGHFSVSKPVPVVYHVPEMHEAQVRYYMDVLGIQDTENFLVRTMEDGVWPLDDPQFLQAAQDRAVFLDTVSFFNPVMDGNDYNATMQKFGKQLFSVLNEGALGVGFLGHLAKPAQRKDGRVTENDWTLQNSIIGSAAYGALLRSVLRIKNLNPDLNDHNVHLYVQGMKNPGLKQFQLQGPPPLHMLVPPGESPTLKQLMSGGDGRKDQALTMLKDGKGRDEICKALKLSPKTLQKWKEEEQPQQDEQLEFDSDSEQGE